MNHALNLCVTDWEWLKVNPIGKVSKEKVNNKIDRWLRPDEEDRLPNRSTGMALGNHCICYEHGPPAG